MRDFTLSEPSKGRCFPIRRALGFTRVREKMSRKVFYAGCLPSFRFVGDHPQFDHLREPPHDYEFTYELHANRAWALLTGPRLLLAILRLYVRCARYGIGLTQFMSFVSSRSPRSQLRVPLGIPLSFVPSWPFFLGEVPWIIEIEDTTSLFRPFIMNGDALGDDLFAKPCYLF